MGRTTVALISRNTKIYSDLNHLLGQDDILLRQVEQWEDMLSFSKTDSPHLIILDCPGSGVDGLAICQEIRADYSGLLVLVSENVDERFHVLALDLGADAFLPRKAGPLLVAANIRALLRRFAPARARSVLTFGRLTVNANRRDVFIAGQAAFRPSSFNFSGLWPKNLAASSPAMKFTGNSIMPPTKDTIAKSICTFHASGRKSAMIRRPPAI